MAVAVRGPQSDLFATRVWAVDVEDGWSDTADSHDHTRSAFVGDALSMDELGGDAHEVTGGDVRDLGAVRPVPRTSLSR
jgi:hypothetical protein